MTEPRPVKLVRDPDGNAFVLYNNGTWVEPPKDGSPDKYGHRHFTVTKAA